MIQDCLLGRQSVRQRHGRSLGVFLNAGKGSSDPAVVVRSDVVPSGFKLVADGPHEVALNILIEDADDALSKTHDLVVSVPGGVNGAHAFLDSCMVAVETSGAVGTGFLCSTVGVDGGALW